MKTIQGILITGVLLAVTGCATVPSRIPPPQFPSVSSTPHETCGSIFRSHRIQLSAADTVKVGNRIFALGDLPDYYRDSEFTAASDATRFHTDKLVYGLLMIGGFVGIDLLVRDTQGDNTLIDAGAVVGSLFGVTWIIAALPSNPKDYIDRYNNYLGNRLGIGWEEQGR